MRQANGWGRSDAKRRGRRSSAKAAAIERTHSPRQSLPVRPTANMSEAGEGIPSAEDLGHLVRALSPNAAKDKLEESDKKETTTPVPILKQINDQNEDGSYTYGYEAADGSFKIETRFPDGRVQGKYGYVDESGQMKIIEYGADSLGFQPVGDLPDGIIIPPPTLGNSTDDDGSFEEEKEEEEVPEGQQVDLTPSPLRARVAAATSFGSESPLLPSQNRGLDLEQPITAAPRLRVHQDPFQTSFLPSVVAQRPPRLLQQQAVPQQQQESSPVVHRVPSRPNRPRVVPASAASAQETPRAASIAAASSGSRFASFPARDVAAPRSAVAPIPARTIEQEEQPQQPVVAAPTAQSRQQLPTATAQPPRPQPEVNFDALIEEFTGGKMASPRPINLQQQQPEQSANFQPHGGASFSLVTGL